MCTSNPAGNDSPGSSDFSPYLEIKNSAIQGQGLFSRISLGKGTRLFEIKGERRGHRYDPFMAEQNPNWIGIGYEDWIVLPPGDIAIYLNHSCSPNVIINANLEVVTLVPVYPDDELLLDYSTTELDPYWKMNCNCGATDCRKVLHSFQFLPNDIQNAYKKYLSPLMTGAEEVLALHQRAS